MPDLGAFFRSVPFQPFSGTVYRISVARYSGSMVSMRGALMYGARYNIRGYFGALYTSLALETARLEMARYFTVPPLGGFVEASIGLRLNRLVDLSDRRILRKSGVPWDELIEPRHTITQEIALRAWENGIEGLLTPSAADPAEKNIVLFLDNQHPAWNVELTTVQSAS